MFWAYFFFALGTILLVMAAFAKDETGLEEERLDQEIRGFASPEFKYSYTGAQASRVLHGSEFAAGYDLSTSDEVTVDPNAEVTMVGTGVKTEIPHGYVGFLLPRSSTYKRYGVYLANTVGVIDSDYRGELKLALRSDRWTEIPKGTPIAQLVVIPHITGRWANHLSETSRGEGGFGSTDDKMASNVNS